jgi:hypothetical protein
MNKRIDIGSIFRVELSNETVAYFQYIGLDFVQLNSEVIAVFKKRYSKNENPELNLIVNDDIEFYVHTMIKLGVKKKLWEKIGDIPLNKSLVNPIFRDSIDYGYKKGEERKEISSNWRIWSMGDNEFIKKNKLTENEKRSGIGLIINPLGVIKMMSGEKYPPLYPEPL